jgi:hypothetical protein
MIVSSLFLSLNLAIHNPLLPDLPGMDEAPALLGKTLSNSLSLLFIIAGVAFFFVFVIGGIRWIVSAGDKEKVGEAKKQITSAIAGLVLIFSVFAVASLIRVIFGINIINFSLPKLLRTLPVDPGSPTPEITGMP